MAALLIPWPPYNPVAALSGGIEPGVQRGSGERGRSVKRGRSVGAAAAVVAAGLAGVLGPLDTATLLALPISAP